MSETINIKKYMSSGGVVLEVGDFYGEDVITSMEETGPNLKILTSVGFYDITLKPGDFLVQTDGSSKLVKSKFDKQDE
jgi:hypothetical protein